MIFYRHYFRFLIVFFVALLLSSCSQHKTGKLHFYTDNLQKDIEVYINEEKIDYDELNFNVKLPVGEHMIRIFSEDEYWIFSASQSFIIEDNKITYVTLRPKRFPTEKTKLLLAKDLQLLELDKSIIKNNKRYIDNKDNTVTDKLTNFTWSKCIAGLVGDNCDKGQVLKLNLEDAKTFANNSALGGHSDWRLPTYVELKTLRYCSNNERDLVLNSRGYIDSNNGSPQNGSCYGNNYQKPTINLEVFPNFPAKRFWSSSRLYEYDLFAWVWSFNSGSMYYDDVQNDNRFILIRDK